MLGRRLPAGHPQRLETLGQVGLCGCLEFSKNIFSPAHSFPLKGGSEQGRGSSSVFVLIYTGSETSRENAAETGGTSGAPEVSVRASSCPGEGQPDFLGGVLFSQKDRCVAGAGPCPPPLPPWLLNRFRFSF